MLETLARNWWALALRGVVAILFGLGAFIWPGLTIAALVILFGAYSIVDGIFAIVAAFSNARLNDRRWMMLLEGIIGIAAGIVAFVWPDITALALLLIIAFWAILTGIVEIMVAIQLRNEINNEWLLIASGALSILFGLLLVIQPESGLITLAWLIGLYAVLFGLTLLGLALRLRNWHSTSNRPTTGVA